jgi:hypothetical protein
MRAEVHIRGDGTLLPGAFVYVRLMVPRARPVPVVAASALVVRKDGTLLAKVRDGQVVLARVTLGRDFGDELEIVEGTAVGDAVILNPSDELETGQRVEVVLEAPVVRL